MKKNRLSILIPTYNSDCTELATVLYRQAEAIPDLSFELLIADDGSTDRTFVEQYRKLDALPHCQFIERAQNVGRAAIRNFLANKAQYPWLLFLDSHMSVDNPQFIENYLQSEGAVVYGGYVVGEGEPSSLRYLYEKACEPQHRPEIRRTRPFQHFHTGNFFVSREVMLAHPFDERFRYYGYEDVLFGKALKQAGLTITHLDNPAGFMTFEDNPHFVDKTEEGLRTLHQFQQELQGYSQMLTFIQNIHIGAVKLLLILWHRLFGRLERRCLCGRHPNLTVFKIYKLGYYLSIKN